MKILFFFERHFLSNISIFISSNNFFRTLLSILSNSNTSIKIEKKNTFLEKVIEIEIGITFYRNISQDF